MCCVPGVLRGFPRPAFPRANLPSPLPFFHSPSILSFCTFFCTFPPTPYCSTIRPSLFLHRPRAFLRIARGKKGRSIERKDRRGSDGGGGGGPGKGKWAKCSTSRSLPQRSRHIHLPMPIFSYRVFTSVFSIPAAGGAEERYAAISGLHE